MGDKDCQSQERFPWFKNRYLISPRQDRKPEMASRYGKSRGRVLWRA